MSEGQYIHLREGGMTQSECWDSAQRQWERANAAQAEADSLRKALEDEREASARIVEATLSLGRLGDEQWARCAIMLAARAVRRGRHLTDAEKLENFRKAMAESDEEAGDDQLGQ